VQPNSTYRSLLTNEFLALNAIMFLTYCNIAVFFQFQTYLGTLAIDQKDSGALIALFSLSVLVLRPLISPFLNPANARRWMMISCASVLAALLTYNLAHTFWSMAVVRLAHGIAYVVLATAALSKLVGCIPKNRSGQAFGLISVITVLPYAIVPPILEPLCRLAGGFLPVLNLSALLMAPTFALLFFVKKHDGDASGLTGKISVTDVKENLKDSRILSLLLLSLVVWTTFTPVFYFLEGQGKTIGILNPGWFFTLSTVAEIAVRLVGGSLFDRGNKSLALAGSMGLLGAGFIAMASVNGAYMFYALGIFLGLGWGLAMPLLNGLMFDLSRPRFRALNSNLAMEMFQCGFFLGPLAGNVVLVKWGYAEMYYLCAAVTLAGMFLAFRLGRKSVQGDVLGDQHY
jgi:predicted MFS family arabinose efflux permease